MDEHECEEWFDFELDAIYTTSTVIEGQYEELPTLKCPKCGHENRII